MKEYLEQKEDVLSQVESNENGLTSEQASSRLEKNGKNKLAEATEANIGNMIAIVYDGEVISAPTVTNAITEGVCVISNLESMEEAKDLAMVIQGGALPYKLELTTVGKAE